MPAGMSVWAVLDGEMFAALNQISGAMFPEQ